MAIANQGYRIDLNFLEHTNDTLALSNLGGVGLANDLAIINNNLRNTGRLPLNSVNLTTDEFVFDTEKVVTISAIDTTVDPDIATATRFTVTMAVPYHTYPGSLITIAGVTGTNADAFNGTFASVQIGSDGSTVAFRKLNTTPPGSADNVSGATVTFTPNTNTVFTNDDIVTLSSSVSVGSTTLNAGTDYFVCNSNAKNKFKLSFKNSTDGIEVIDITSVPSQFNFIRREPVSRLNLESFIRPEIQDEEIFGSYLGDSVNNIFEAAQSRIENSNYFIGQKYKGTENTVVNTKIATEGTINLLDPTSYNNTKVNLDSTVNVSPGVYIGNTRAFSADNNPWSPDNSDPSNPSLSTASEEVSIGELLFGDTLVIDGITVTSSATVAATTFTHKIPVVIDGETYYLVMKT